MLVAAGMAISVQAAVLLLVAVAPARSVPAPYEAAPPVILERGKGRVSPQVEFPHRWHFHPPSSTATNRYAFATGKLGQLAVRAQAETFLDRLMGTNCYSKALTVVTGDCAKLDTEEKYRLALELLNCHQRVVGGPHYACDRSQQFQQCVAGMPDRDHGVFAEFLTNIERLTLCPVIG